MLCLHVCFQNKELFFPIQHISLLCIFQIDTFCLFKSLLTTENSLLYRLTDPFLFFDFLLRQFVHFDGTCCCCCYCLFNVFFNKLHFAHLTVHFLPLHVLFILEQETFNSTIFISIPNGSFYFSSKVQRNKFYLFL